MADEVRRDLPSFSASVLNKTEYLCQDDVGDGTTESHAGVIDQDVSGCISISVCSLAYYRSYSIADRSEVYNAPFFFKITCISRVINKDTKSMFVQGILARESVLFVVVTVDLNQTVCYQLRQPFGDVVCLYQD